MLDKIEDAIKSIKQGKPIIIVDDENRENEGDLVIPTEMATYEIINFMVKEARGLVCVPIEEDLAIKLNLNPMVENNSDNHGTAFTASIDHINTTTGISVGDRLKTIKSISDSSSKKEDFRRPGHIFPLIAKKGGVMERRGHTEATIEIAKLSGLHPSGVICEIINEDGSMSRLLDLKKFASKHNLKIISIDSLVKYLSNKNKLVHLESEARMPTKYGNFILKAYKNFIDNKEHMALVKGDVYGKENVKVRIHSECFTGDILGSNRCDCGNQLQEALTRIEEEGEGVLIYMRQEGRGIGIYNKLKAYNLQDEGMDTVEANLYLGFEDDMRDYLIASEIIKDLKIKSVKLLTNNPRKIEGLRKYNIIITEREGIYTELTSESKKYFESKIKKLNHIKK